ncbi:hypothetical protein Tco_0983471, partial [Tanacetum coccineum]
NEQRSRVRSIIGRVANSTRYGNRKLGNFRRLSVVGKSNKGYLRSQATNDQRILAEDKRGLLPKDLRESRKIRVKAPQYKLIRGSLYRRSFYTSWLRCVASPQTENIIKEIHEGSYGFNAKPCSMVVRITKQGYYWAVDAQRRCKETSRLREMQGAIRDKESSRKRCDDSRKWMTIQSLGNDRGRIKEVDKRRGSKEIASIEEAYYQASSAGTIVKGVVTPFTMVHATLKTELTPNMVTFNEVERIRASQRRPQQEDTSDWRLEQRME